MSIKCFFYPNRPCGHAINNIIGRLGWTITTDVEDADICFWWKFTAEHEELPSILNDKVCINAGCDSTLKDDVEKRFVDAFGVTTFVDPLTYQGEAVVKDNLNATHDGEVIRCPIKKTEKGKIYQRLLSDVNDIINMRVPVIGGEVPYVIVQHKNDLFKGALRGGVVFAEVMTATDVFTDEWLKNLKEFCDGYIDIAEIDVVDGCIIDVNNTPSDATYVGMPEGDYCKSECSELLKKHFGNVSS